VGRYRFDSRTLERAGVEHQAEAGPRSAVGWTGAAVVIGNPRAAGRPESQASAREFVFPCVGRTGHVVEIKKGWASICKSAGISGLRLHDLRHSFASQLVSSGASLAMIGSLLGHSSPMTTARYSHMFSDPQRAAVESVAAVITAAGKNESAPEPIPFTKHCEG
jgi:Phage integrase family